MLFTFNIEDFNLNKFEKIAIDYLNKNLTQLSHIENHKFPI